MPETERIQKARGVLTRVVQRISFYEEASARIFLSREGKKLGLSDEELNPIITELYEQYGHGQRN